MSGLHSCLLRDTSQWPVGLACAASVTDEPLTREESVFVQDLELKGLASPPFLGYQPNERVILHDQAAPCYLNAINPWISSRALLLVPAELGLCRIKMHSDEQNVILICRQSNIGMTYASRMLNIHLPGTCCRAGQPMNFHTVVMMDDIILAN